MKSIQVKYKLLYPNSKSPYRKYPEDAGMDLYAHSRNIDWNNGIVDYGLGIALEIPDFHVALAFPRSSIFKFNLTLSNSVGVIDSNYRGEIRAKFRIPTIDRVKHWMNKKLHTKFKFSFYKVGERCVQILLFEYPKVELSLVDELNSSNRMDGGFGHTGTK